MLDVQDAVLKTGNSDDPHVIQLQKMEG